jgi:membrane protease YdiL (CAAX protease family)
VSPKFAQSWYVAARSVIYADEVAYGQLANVLYLLSLCVLAPLLEEITFRGIVLDRWIHKWGIRTGILSSSALFALFHLNPLGAFVFAITMSFLYLKTQSLVLPMICHAANNFVGWLWAFGSLAIHGPAPSVGQWLSTRMPEAIVSAAIALWWIVRYEKRIRNELLTSRTAA